MTSIQVQQFIATIPAGTAIATPVTVQMQLTVFQVDAVHIRVPKGHNGQTGFFIASSGQQIIPFRAGNVPVWINANDETFRWDLAELPQSGDYQLVGYNLGNFDHTFHVRWELSNTPDPSPGPPPTMLAVADLSTLATG